MSKDNMKRRAAWWWIDRWRKSTAYTDMSAEQQGVYRNLLDELWLRDGTIPNDERVLAKIGGDPEAWPRVRDAVLGRFYAVPDGLRHETHDEIASWPEKQAEKGRKRAEGATRQGGRFSPATPAEPPAATPAENQPDDQPQHQPPSPSPSPYSVSVLRTPVPSERTEPPRSCDHAFARKRFAETGRTTVCACGEEFRAVSANPFVVGRRAELESESMRLSAKIAELTGDDPAEVFRTGANYEGAKRSKFNPATLSDDRLLATVSDLRATLKAIEARQPRKPVSA